MLRLLDIPSRPLVQREKDYIAAWDDLGFDDEAIRMAYEPGRSPQCTSR